MVVCIGSYIAAKDSEEGVKLEDRVVIAKNGPELLSTSTFEQDILA